MTLNTTSKTAQNVATTVRRQFGDESGVQVTDADLFRWINDGQRRINNKNKVLKGRAAVNAVVGQGAYTVPEVSIASIDSLHFKGIPLQPITFPEVETFILSRYDASVNPTGAPVMWYEYGGTVTLWPAPTTADEITLFYTKEPVEIIAITDTLSLPDKYFNALLKFVLAQAYEMDEDWDASNYKTQQFEDDLSSTADDERTTAQMTYPTISAIVDY